MGAFSSQKPAPDVDYSTATLHVPWAGFSRLDIGPYKIGIAITTEGGTQDPEDAGAALAELIRRGVEASRQEDRDDDRLAD